MHKKIPFANRNVLRTFKTVFIQGKNSVWNHQLHPRGNGRKKKTKQTMRLIIQRKEVSRYHAMITNQCKDQLFLAGIHCPNQNNHNLANSLNPSWIHECHDSLFTPFFPMMCLWNFWSISISAKSMRAMRSAMVSSRALWASCTSSGAPSTVILSWPSVNSMWTYRGTRVIFWSLVMPPPPPQQASVCFGLGSYSLGAAEGSGGDFETAIFTYREKMPDPIRAKLKSSVQKWTKWIKLSILTGTGVGVGGGGATPWWAEEILDRQRQSVDTLPMPELLTKAFCKKKKKKRISAELSTKSPWWPNVSQDWTELSWINIFLQIYTEQLLTLGCSSVILRMLAPFLPMMKRWSQAGAVTSDVATLFALKKHSVPYVSQFYYLVDPTSLNSIIKLNN